MAMERDRNPFAKSDSALSGLEAPLHAETERAVRDLIQAEGEAHRQDVERQMFGELTEDEAQCGTATQVAERHRPLLEATEREVLALPPAFVWRGLLAGLGFVVSLPAEWMLNLSVVPWLLGVPQ